MFLVFPFFSVTTRSVSCSRRLRAKLERGRAASSPVSFDVLQTVQLLCLQCECCKLRQSGREPGGSGFLGYRHLPTAPASTVQSLRLISLRTTLRFNWHMLLHLIYIMWLMIPPSVSYPLLCQQFHTRQGGSYCSRSNSHVCEVNERFAFFSLFFFPQ